MIISYRINYFCFIDKIHYKGGDLLMKNNIKRMIVILNFYRLFFITFFILNKETRRMIYSDLDRINNKEKRFWKLSYHLILDKPFRNIFAYRIKRKSFMGYLFFRILFPLTREMEITGSIGEGFAIYHGQSLVLHCSSIGKNFSVYQNVTIGRNKDHYLSNGKDKPIIGDNVKVYPGAIVAGGIFVIRKKLI